MSPVALDPKSDRNAEGPGFHPGGGSEVTLRSVEFTCLRDGVSHTATCSWQMLPDTTWRVSVGGSFFTESAVAPDAFDALRQIRRHLEPAGWSLGLAGALPNVWPSGMARSTGGTRAYVLDDAKISKGEALDLVDVFAPVPPESVATVADQLACARHFLGSRVR